MSKGFYAALALLAGCGLYGVDGNGERVNEARPLQGFSAVSCDGSLDVTVQRGDEFRVEVSIDSNLLPLVHTDVSGDVLRIDSDRIGDTVAGPNVILTMPALRSAALNGSGSVWAGGFQETQPVLLALDGSGYLTFVGDAPRVDVRLSGSGDTRLEGTADALSVVLDGSGTVDAYNFAATTADLALSGSGDVAATVSGAVRVSLSGSGTIDLYGDAVLERVDVSGSGEIRRH